MSLYQNISKLKWISALRFYDVLLPFYMIYAHLYGLSYLQVFATQIVFALSLLILEIPGGIFSDIYSRKLSLFLGSASLLIGSLFFLTWRSFTGFCLAEFFLAIGVALYSGTDTALLYETTHALNQPKTYLAQEGSMQAYARYAEALSGITGGIFAQFSLFVLVFINFIVNIPNLYLTASLNTTQKTTNHKQFKSILKTKLSNQLSLVKDSLFNKKKVGVRLILVYSALISSITLTSFWLLQVLMKDHNLSFISIGIIWLIYHSLTGYCSQQSEKTLKLFSVRGILWLLPLLLQIMAITLGVFSSNWVLPLILLAGITFGIKMPFINYLLNNRLQSSTRATVFSIDSMLTRLIFSVMSLVTGYMLDHGTINHVFLMITIPNIAIIWLAYKLSREHTSIKLQDNS